VAHAGVLKALEAEGLHPDLIVGTSAGALAGAFLAAGISAARTAMWAEALHWSGMVRPTLSRKGIFSNDRLARLLEQALPVRTFAELTTPFVCMATDLETSEAVLIREGELVSALCASCAIPGLIIPVEREGRHLIDGGVTANVPTAVARQLGAEIVVAVDVNQSFRRHEPPSNMWSIMVHSFFTIGRAAERPHTELADLVIAPDVGEIGYDQLHRGSELVAVGQAAAERAIPALKRLLSGGGIDSPHPAGVAA
jgi:NTE family protein